MAAFVGVGSARAQGASDFPDVSANHWAYQAVHDLADKGLVKGYLNGQFLGSRAMTRYEFATVIDRLLQTIADMKAQPVPAPAGPAVTPDDLNKIQVLVDTFQPELDDIKVNLSQARQDIDALRQEVSETRDLAVHAQKTAETAQQTAENSYGFGTTRKFQITGYIQARYLYGSSGAQSSTIPATGYVFPRGTAAISNPYNGTYASGANDATAELRRSRLRILGQVTQNSRYSIQFDAAGNSNSTPVSIREGDIGYTFNDGDAAKQPTMTAGLFPTPFGYMVPLSAPNVLTPERPLAFNETNAGIFNGDDFDKGAEIVVPEGRTRYTAALVNGSGFGTNGNFPGTSTDRHLDQIYRVAYSGGSQLSGGISYYNGEIPNVANVPASTSLTSPVDLATNPQRKLFGVDAQYNPTPSVTVLGEFLGGEYDQITYDAANGDPALGTTKGNANTFSTGSGLLTIKAPGNRMDGYYLTGGYTFTPTGSHPFTVLLDYDVLQRSLSGFGGTKGIASGSGSNWDDKNFGYGVLYALDKQMRLRFWYIMPSSVAHNSVPHAGDPPNDGLLTTEVQLKF